MNFELNLAVARKTRKKHRWLRLLFLFVITPLIIWFLAFVIWFYWNDITKLLSTGKGQRGTVRNVDKPERPETPAERRAQEKILDEDRKKLDAILKERR